MSQGQDTPYALQSLVFIELFTEELLSAMYSVTCLAHTWWTLSLYFLIGFLQQFLVSSDFLKTGKVALLRSRYYMSSLLLLLL